MDSYPAPTSSSRPSATKLPVKRKTSDSFTLLPDPDSYPNPDPSFQPLPLPPNWTFKSHNHQSETIASSVHGVGEHHQRHPPFKYHRIWTEPDEIQFLLGLLDCGSENLSFPRDLNEFYTRFSKTMSQPYTKSQLSEKLRRLRKKYRVISSRLGRGLGQSFLPPHDRALYELSKQLWHPDYSKTSPFGVNTGRKPVNIQSIPEVPSDLDPILVENFVSVCEINDNGVHDQVFLDVGFDGEVKLSKVNVDIEEEKWGQVEEDRMGDVTAKAIMDVFDECLKEVKVGSSGCVKKEKSRGDFQRRWEEQRIAELEALGQRVRLVLEHSLLQRR